ncbi:troponin C, isoallergen Bla g 6.0101-like [Anopheles nili]|uniref:troponin C, isoallergen Bla g 6.0101-like n=1 Tax=Anopheles nili TaxID=185578 RepID=UPI00237A6709|nr:troponin C, isoallergen Bla g 6.0101-like [Anopheles nili]
MSDTMSDAGESTGTGTGKELSKDQLKVLRDAFNAFDKEKTGSISTDVVGTILELLGHKLSEEELEEVIEEYDEDESGQLEFDEFVALASNYVEPEEDYDALRKELREVFMMYDKDAKGYLPVEEFKAILRELDGAVPEEELDDIVDEIDADGSGTVDFEEFMEVMTADYYA